MKFKEFVALMSGCMIGAVINAAIISPHQLSMESPASRVNACMIARDDFPAKYVGEFTFTHYAKTGHRTATQSIPRINKTIAVDPKVIPLHSIVYIQGLGYFVAEDTGGLIKGNKIDIYVEDHNLAVRLGTLQGKKLKVWVMTQEGEDNENAN